MSCCTGEYCDKQGQNCYDCLSKDSQEDECAYTYIGKWIICCPCRFCVLMTGLFCAETGMCLKHICKPCRDKSEQRKCESVSKQIKKMKQDITNYGTTVLEAKQLSVAAQDKISVLAEKLDSLEDGPKKQNMSLGYENIPQNEHE